jgi:bacteriorhodopsin
MNISKKLIKNSKVDKSKKLIKNSNKLINKSKKLINYDLTNPMYISFFASFLALSGTTVITFLASFTTEAENNKYLRGSLISETCVNIIAGFTYTYFLKFLADKKLQLENVTTIRYIDWFLTTPLLLVSFAFYTAYSDGKNDGLDAIPLIYIIVLNTLMLLAGFFGETKKIGLYTGFFLGFAFFAPLMYFLYDKYIKDSESDGNLIVYIVFVIVWGLYGFAYLLNTKWKNISYNTLDVISKAGFGMLIWLSIIL